MIILFDLDGTLIDSTEAIVSTFHHSFDVHGLKRVQDDEIKKLIGYPLDITCKKLGVPEDKIWNIVATYKERYKKISTRKTKLLPFAKKAIELASNFATLGIVTTKTGAYSKILMEHFDLMQHFKTLIGRENVTHPKPHPEPILKALNELACSDDDVWMIGDTKLDLISAKKANVNSIGVLCGYSNKEELKQHTNIIFSDTLKAVKFLQNLNQKAK